MHGSSVIQEFIDAVRSRLGWARAVAVFSIGLLAVASLLAVWALWWIIPGYAVRGVSYVVAAGVWIIGSLAVLLFWKPSRKIAASTADRAFGLKDALVSHLGFTQEHRAGDFYALQTQQTADKLGKLDVKQIPVTWPRRMLAIAVIVLGAAVWMGFRKPSDVVVQRLVLEEETHSKTAEINKELKEQIEELIKHTPDDEQELLKPDEWRQWVKQLEQTKDQKEALRQYAELERRMQEAAQKLSQRGQEQLLSKAAQELQQEAELKATGKKLEEKNYKEAAADLKKMELRADVQKPDEARKEMARLKAAAQRLAAAAKSHQQRSGQQGQGQGKQSNSEQNQAQAQQGKSGQQAGAQGSQGDKSGSQMQDAMEGLDQAMQMYEKALQSPNSDKQNASQCQSQANAQLNKLCNSLSRCSSQREAMKKMMSFCKACSQCQGYLANKQCQSLGQCMATGQGKGIGSASVDSRRSETELTQDNGNRDQLQGVKGQGPSQTSIEAADSGTGTATRMIKAQERSWQRQLESFVQREDVPAEVKDGVKEYFKGIQQVGEDAKAK